MPSTQIDIKGTIEWAKVFESNRDQAEWNVDTNGEYKVTVTTDKKTADALKKAGCQKKIEEVDDGHRLTVSRPHTGAEDWMGGEPVVADIAGKAWDLEDKGLIGNGSKGIVKVEVYRTKKGLVGTRLMGLQVLDHVVYESEGGSSQTPSSMFQDHSKSSGGKSSSSQEPQDSVPF
jgi:hypothetical protein|tara:strand:+ start:282 stop:806 length:525 start_codon:yes stop_codon:yes gene_type:complete